MALCACYVKLYVNSINTLDTIELNAISVTS